jgi:hypothetical protein
MISIGDVVKYRLEEIEFEAEALKQPRRQRPNIPG